VNKSSTTSDDILACIGDASASFRVCALLRRNKAAARAFFANASYQPVDS
jgi:hypothetical protein